MPKQIITLEIEFDVDQLKESRGYPLPSWLLTTIVSNCRWISNVTVLNISPVHWGVDDDPDEIRESMVDKGDIKWLNS